MDRNEHHPDRQLRRCLVVYESMFGNTEDVAWAVADGLDDTFDVQLLEVGNAPDRLDDIDLLVVGAPTHAFGLSRRQTRRDAGAKGARPAAAEGVGMREWLAGLQRPQPGIAAAAFDTRIRRPRPPGSAARAVSRRLRRLGFHVPTKPVSFSVAGTPGPLTEGELERATEWGRHLAACVGTRREVRTAGN